MKQSDTSPLGIANPQRKHKEPHPLRRRFRQPPAANINLQRLMQQLRLIKTSITLGSLLQEPVLGQVGQQIAVALPLLVDSHERNGLLAGGGGVVVAGPDSDVVRQAEEFAGGLVEGFCASAGEIAAGDA